MKQIRVYQIIIILLFGVIVYGYFAFVKQGIETKKNYRQYVKKVEEKVGFIPLSERLGNHYMVKYKEVNRENFYGIILTKEVIDFYKIYLDQNGGTSISVGFAKYDTTGFKLAGLTDDEYVRRQSETGSQRQPKNKYGLIFGVIDNGTRGILPFNINGSKIYDNWNQEWP